MKTYKFNIFKVLLLIFTISLINLSFVTSYYKNILEIDSDGYAKIKTISSGIQRVTKLELDGNSDDYLMALLYYTALELDPIHTANKYFTDENIYPSVKEFTGAFNAFLEAVKEFQEDGVRDVLFSVSENNYMVSANVTNKVKIYLDDLTDYIKHNYSLIGLNILIIGLILLKMVHNNVLAIKQNREMSIGMRIDMTTGVYDTSKCQELLMRELDGEDDNGYKKAVIIFDIDNLKRINTSVGYNTGDYILASFAKYLKDSTKVLNGENIIARYGGDEFMVYFSAINEKDIFVYIEELDFLVGDFNETENKQYNLKFSYGYSITTENTKRITMQELLDEAEQKMCANKLQK